MTRDRWVLETEGSRPKPAARYRQFGTMGPRVRRTRGPRSLALRRPDERRYGRAEAILRAAGSLWFPRSRLIQPSITSSLAQEVIRA